MVGLERRKYSDRLGEIDGRQLQRACDAFELGRLERAEPASAGQWGQNILMSTIGGAFVLRGNPLVPHQLEKECLVAEVIHESSTLPAPWPYRVSDDTAIFGWPFAVMPLLPGTMGSKLWAGAGAASRIELSAAHGRALAALHQVSFEAPGPYDEQSRAFGVVSDFRDWTLERIGSLRSRCQALDALSPDDERFIDHLIDDCADTLSEPFDPVLVHHDFSLANTNYERTDGHYTATGVFDLGEAHAGNGEEDLVRFLFRRKREQRTAFLAAYAHERPFRAGANGRLTLFALADLLFLWQVSASVTDWFGGASFVDTATPVVRAAAGAAHALR